MRLLLIALLLLSAAIQFPLWWGKGGWFEVYQLRERVATQQDNNDALSARNDALAAEVQDLKSGQQAIEERARSELGMLAPGERYVQLLGAPAPATVRPPRPARAD